MTDETNFATEQPAPSPVAPEAAPVETDAAKENLAKGISLLAEQGEDISNYVAERADQDAYLNGEPLSDERRAAWNKRAHEAVQKATREAADAAGNLETKQWQETAGQDPQYFGRDEVQEQLDSARRMGAGQVRFQQYYGDDQERRTKVVDWHAAMDPEGTVGEYYIDSPVGPQMAEMLADYPDQLQALAQMPARQREINLGKLEGFIVAQQQFATQQQSYAPQPRTVTKAPPPMRSPRGGANPPSDAFKLAQREDATDYIRARQAQEKRR